MSSILDPHVYLPPAGLACRGAGKPVPKRQATEQAQLAPESREEANVSGSWWMHGTKGQSADHLRETVQGTLKVEWAAGGSEAAWDSAASKKPSTWRLSRHLRGNYLHTCSSTKWWRIPTATLGQPNLQPHQENGPLRQGLEQCIHNNGLENGGKPGILVYCRSVPFLYTCTESNKCLCIAIYFY